MKLLSKRSSSRTSITARSINEGKELSYQMLYNEVQRLADEEANKKKKKKIYVYKSDVSKSQSYVPKYDPENFNLMKRIKEIRKVTKENNMDITKQNSNIAFAKDKIDIVFESTKLLKELQKRKTNTLNEDDSSLSAFLLENKEISIKNLLIKLLKGESDKLDSKEREVRKKLAEGQENYKNDQKCFMEYSDIQKKACKEIEKVLIEIQRKNKELAEIEKSYRIQCKNTTEEIEKTLEQIDNSRICAKFVNQVLGGDTSKYQKPILPEENDNPNTSSNINYEEITQDVIKQYNYCLNEDIKENPVLNNPNNMLIKFAEFEDSILRMLQFKNKFEEEREKTIEDNNIVLKELYKREEMHNAELDILQEEYYNHLKDWEKLELNHDNSNSSECASLIEDIHKVLVGNDYLALTKSIKKKQISDIIKEAMSILRDKETSINVLISQLEIYENNMNLFYQIVNSRKNQNKENKQTLAKMNLEQIQNIKKKKAEERFNRIIVQSRKTEPPFHFVKKVKKVVVDTEEVKREIDKDLINY